MVETRAELKLAGPGAMVKPNVLDILGESEIFVALDDAEREAVVGAFRPVTFAPGQVIFSRGDLGRELYMVLSGRVRLSVLTLDGRELSFAHAEPGSIFGEIAMLDGLARTADATAVGRTEAMTLTHGDLERLLAEAPQLAMSIVKFLCRRLREADLQLEGVALHRIEVRLARYIAARAGQSAVVSEDGRIEVDLGISQGELAMLLGASRPKVNAAMKFLETEELIERRGNSLTCDLEEIRAFAELD